MDKKKEPDTTSGRNIEVEVDDPDKIKLITLTLSPSKVQEIAQLYLQKCPFLYNACADVASNILPTIREMNNPASILTTKIPSVIVISQNDDVVTLKKKPHRLDSQQARTSQSEGSSSSKHHHNPPLPPYADVPHDLNTARRIDLERRFGPSPPFDLDQALSVNPDRPGPSKPRLTKRDLVGDENTAQFLFQRKRKRRIIDSNSKLNMDPGKESTNQLKVIKREPNWNQYIYYLSTDSSESEDDDKKFVKGNKPKK